MNSNLNAKKPQLVKRLMAIVQHCRCTHGIVTQLRSVSYVNSRFSFVSFDQEMRNRIPRLAKFFEEIPCTGDSLSEVGGKTEPEEVLTCYYRVRWQFSRYLPRLT